MVTSAQELIPLGSRGRLRVRLLDAPFCTWQSYLAAKDVSVAMAPAPRPDAAIEPWRRSAFLAATAATASRQQRPRSLTMLTSSDLTRIIE
jgi:hypothetical protein